ncbi:MAG: DNRLRE domain-containing protein [Phaeodactylibacter sp.]|nr:DNRLRE domain-containing protein [Phaeodactylibacter sp.]MCB9298871.1 DNRLRE domain-containing protein [Lewinellaceae bacterium]
MVKMMLFLPCLCGFSLLAAQTFTIRPDSEAGKDAEIWSYQTGLTDGGYRESGNVFTWTMGGSLAVKRSLMAFNLDSLPPAENLMDARLNLYFNPVDQYESSDGHSGNNAIYVERIISKWEEHEVFWGNQPGTTPENRTVLPASQTSYQDYIDINVTGLVEDMLNDPQGSHGFMIRMQDEFTPYSMCILASSDHPDPALRPSLVLSFDEVQAASPEVQELEIFPNPVLKGIHNSLFLSSSKFDGKRGRYQVFDQSGRMRTEGELLGGSQAIDISTLGTGAYLLIVEREQESACLARFVIL